MIGQTNKELLTVLEERQGVNASEPNYVLTRLGSIASGGRVGVRSDSHQVLKAKVKVDCDTNECERLRQEIIELKAALRQVELENEETQPSRSKELACSLVELDVGVKDGRYDIPVPLRQDIVKKIRNNFSSPLERTMSLRRKALGDFTLNRTLTAGIGKLRPANKFIVALERPHFKCIKRKIANKLITIQVCVHAG